MTDLRKRVGDAMQATKPREDGHVMFEDVRDAAIKAVLDRHCTDAELRALISAIHRRTGTRLDLDTARFAVGYMQDAAMKGCGL